MTRGGGPPHLGCDYPGPGMGKHVGGSAGPAGRQSSGSQPLRYFTNLERGSSAHTFP
jgi:hypothetical protein